MIRLLLSLFLVAHAVAHLVGFAVPWQLVQSAGVPYRTTVLGGSWDIGATGVRLLGIGWLAVAVTMGIVAGGLLFDVWWWRAAAYAAVGASLVLCVLGWPDSWIGLAANVVVLGLLAASARV